jgi:hypothetical protein
MFGDSDYLTVKLDSAGNQLWAARYNGPGDWFDYAYDVGVDPSGNVYVTGYCYDVGYVYNIGTVKYDSSGSQLWVARYQGPDIGAIGQALAVDPSGNVYVAGTSFTAGTDGDYTLIKYDTSGNELWVARYNGPGNGYDLPLDVVLDSSGGVYLTGLTEDDMGKYDYMTMKYDTSGSQQWCMFYEGAADGDDLPQVVIVDSSSNVYVGGYSENDQRGYDFATIKYAGAQDPMTALEGLIDTKEAMGLHHGIENSLDAKLDNALKSLEKENYGPAINQLEAFINECEAQRGKKLTEEQADTLITGAEGVIAAIEGLM